MSVGLIGGKLINAYIMFIFGSGIGCHWRVASGTHQMRTEATG